MSRTDTDILVSRIVDGIATDDDWSKFKERAEADALLWRQLAEAQQDQADLAHAVSAAICIADNVEAPARHEMTLALANRTRLVATWGGWVAAAVVALAWAGVGLPGTTNTSGQTASPTLSSATDALQQYLNQGQSDGTVIGELPEKVIVSTEQTEDGLKVFYLRPILEVRVFTDLFHLDEDEAGRAVLREMEIRENNQGWY